MGLRLDDAPAHELDGLQISLRARGVQSGSLELFGHVRRSFAIALGAGLSSLEAVVGKRRDMTPPAGLIGANRRWALGGHRCCHHRCECDNAEPDVVHGLDHSAPSAR